MSTTNKRISIVTDTEEITAVKAPPAGLLRESRIIAVPGKRPAKDEAGQEAQKSAPPPAVTAAPPAPRGSAPMTPTGRPPGPAGTGSGSSAASRSPAAATAPAAAPPGMAPRTTAPLPAAAAGTQPAGPPRATAPLPSVPAGPSPGIPRFTPPRARVISPVPRLTAPVPIAPVEVASFSRPIVDLVPVAPGTGGLSFGAPPAGLVLAEPKERSAALVVSEAVLESPGALIAPTRTRSRAGLYAALIGLLVGGAGLAGWRQWSARPGRVEITTTPADAIISVGNEALDEHSPASLQRPPGVYEISVAREGYQHTHRTVELHAGEELALAVALTPTNTEPTGPQAPIAAPAAVAAGARPGPAVARRPIGAAPRPGPARPGTRPERGIAAMLAARSGLLRDLSSPEHEAAQTDSASTPPAAAPQPSNSETPPPTMAIETGREPAAAPSPAPESEPSAPAPAGARMVSSRIARAQLLIDPNADEYRVAMPPSLARAEMKLAAVVKICVAADGKVASVKLLKSADPAIDPQIPAVLGKWRFRPLLVNNRAVPFCYTTQYEIGQ